MSKEVHGATRHGIKYFTGSVPPLLVETCRKIRVQEGSEAQTLEIGDEYMGQKIQDILRKSTSQVKGYELVPESDSEGGVEIVSDRVIAFSRRSVTESSFLKEDLKKAPNYEENEEEEASE